MGRHEHPGLCNYSIYNWPEAVEGVEREQVRLDCEGQMWAVLPPLDVGACFRQEDAE